MKQIPLPKLKKKLWKLCSEYIKRRDGTRCVSCGSDRANQTGHFLPKSACNIIYKYYEKNLGRQCANCNLFLKGNYPGFRKYLIKKYGQHKVDVMELAYRYNPPLSFNAREWVEKKIEFYQKLIKKWDTKTRRLR